ncbi:TonB-dependent receptor [Hymenobacter chitinivorans]|uniref:Iron complex outermembrane receptor protein n=1 Tax=Hymenobacter chitinivorans DSM 11115 TaxID=1121954 RepID=A0A2M9BNU2_9BACT|nr:TonB-dependent receptor [Hymenobacter chitinivorans]PJJ59615.1 iron complex outermembrane receptor protein [Hymenobacter chitinivorans DSM 11115]
MKPLLFRVLLFWGALFLSTSAFAQFTTSGTVVDQQTRQPLVGAVVAASTATAATTDKDGRFQLTSTEELRTVKVQYLGYLAQDVTIKAGTTNALTIALEPSNTGLSEVQVVGYATEKKLLETPVALSVVTEKDIQRNNSIFLQNTLNQVPGVRMNVRSAASQSNLVIRGIGSTYGRFSIRGIKLYQNGIPLSEADGTTSLDDLDFTTIGRMDVIKGPASSIYGATLGGVVSFQTRKAAPGTSINLGTVVGKYGLFRTNTGIGIGTDKVNLLVNYGHQETRGFREDHSNSRKDFVTVAGDFYVSDKQTVSVLGTYTNQHDNYAGELDSTDFFTNYTKLAPAYKLKDVGVDAEITRLGLTHTYRFTGNFVNTTTLFMSTSYSLSPVEPNFAHTQRGKRGVRSVFTYSPELGGLQTRFAVGTEYISNQDNNKRYGITALGASTAITSDQEIRATQLNTFAQAEVSITEHTTLTVGDSYNVVTYDIQDLIPKTAPALSLTGYKQFKPVHTPRVALIHTFNDQFSVFAQYSTGFSPPISSQISLSTGPINPDLKPERNNNLELGSRGSILGNKLNYDVTAFRMQVKNGLVSQTNADKVTYFVNSGESEYKGVEVALSGNLVDADKAGVLTQVRPFVSYTYTDAEFKSYQLAANDFSGKQVPGTFKNLFTGGLDLETKVGVYLNLTSQYTDKTPMADSNNRFAGSYWLFNSKVGARGKVAGHLSYDVFAGLDNITDEHYAVSIALNQATPVKAPTFYNPGMPRNWYSGANLSYTF